MIKPPLVSAFIAVAVMIFCCYKLISEKEFEVLSLYKWFNKVIKEESCEQ